MMLRRLLCTFVIAAGLGSVAPLAASADSLLGTSSFPTHVSSYGGVTAWSETAPRREVQCSRYREKGKITHPKVKEREGGPFDVTLGPGRGRPHGRALLALPTTPTAAGATPTSTTSRSKKETRVEQISPDDTG